MAVTEGMKRIEKLGTAITLWGGLAGLLIWCAVLFIRGSFGLGELLFMVGVPVICGATLRLFVWIAEGFLAPRPS
jgi:hypothetical protein